MTPWLRIYEIDPPLDSVGAKIAVWADVRRDPSGRVMQDSTGRVTHVVAGYSNNVGDIVNSVHSNARNVGSVPDGRWSA